VVDERGDEGRRKDKVGAVAGYLAEQALCVADIRAVHDSRFYALELKASGRRSTAAQIAFRDEINAAGGFAAEAVGIDAARRCLESWGLLRGQTQ
jgi:hypothetical protein